PGLPSLRGYPGFEALNIHSPERVASNARHSIQRNQFSRGLPLRRFRPPIPAHIEFRERRPVLMRSALFNGVIADVRGPFFSSGNWWENNRWWREEWDIQTSDGTLYRIFRPAEDGETVGRSCPVRVPPARAARPTWVASRTVENAEPCPGGMPDNSSGFQAW